ncbi:MAG: serine/threonine-protein kinase [Coleofasciculaceae cyanobacterium]
MPLYCSQGHENESNNRFCCSCGQRLPLAVGQTLDKRYRLISHLGQGGFGRAYLAEALHRFNEHCVLKEFAPQVQGTAELAKAKELFHREAGALHKLKHPQLPGFWELFQVDFGAGNGCLLFVQDYIEGQTYFDLLKSGMRLNEAEIIQFLQQMLAVLSYIHSQGVIHRDISPDNIILRTSDHLPVLIDFGGVKQIAATAISKLTQINTSTRLGKKGYAPEEQLRKGEVFVNSDLYSLAVTALVLFTGKEPQSLYDAYQGTWRWEQEINISSQLKTVLQKMLAHQPNDRFINAAAVLQALPSPQSNYQLGLQTKSTSPIIKQVVSVCTIPARISQVSKIFTLVLAPKAKPAPIVVTANFNQPVVAPQPYIKKPSLFLSSLISLTLKLTVGTGIILLTSWAGWAVMNSVISSTKLDFGKSPSLPNTAPNASEITRIEKLFSRRQTLGISEVAFNNGVNQKFYAKHPELNGRPLTNSPEDAELREEWYMIAEEFLR